MIYFGIDPPVVHHVGAVLDESGVGSEVWQNQLPPILEHALLPPTMTLSMSPVIFHVAFAQLSPPQVPLIYPRAGGWCAPVSYEICVAAVDVPNIPTGHHLAPSPEPPYGHLPQTLAACIRFHVAS